VAIALEDFLEEEYVPGLIGVFDQTSKHATREMSRVLGVSFQDIGFPQQRAEWVRRNVSLIKSVSFDRLKDMEDVLNGVLPGQDRVEDVRGRLMDEFGLSKSRADLIARDQTLKLNSQLSQARATSVGVSTYTWVTSRDERVRSGHAALHGKVFRYDTPPVTNPRTGEVNHPGQDYQCLTGDQKVALPGSIQRLYRRWYDGELATIVTDSGVALKATPNHPVLTQTGWKAAKHVQVGDYVVEVGQDSPYFRESQIKYGVRFADLFKAFSSVLQVQRVVVSEAEFHSDVQFPDHKVDVIDVARDLWVNRVFAFPKSLRKLYLPVTDADVVETVGLTGGEGELVGPGQRATAHPLIGLSRLLFSKLGAGVGKTQNIRLGPGPNVLALADQELVDCLTRGSEALCDSLYRNALSVESKALLFAEVCAIVGNPPYAPIGYQPPSAEFFAEQVGGYADAIGNGLNGKAFGVKLRRVVDNRLGCFSGHVYNAETSCNWYATSIVVHNCRCVAVPNTNELLGLDTTG
jgi:SPP1 gp7 family putative phage head morphogenesis protein